MRATNQLLLHTFFHSFLVFSLSVPKLLYGDDTSPSFHTSSLERIELSDTAIFTADFGQNVSGIYTKEQLRRDWDNPPWSDGVDEQRVSIVETKPSSKALAVTFPAHTYGSEKNGAVWRLNFQ